jgi:hypothetical protein
MTRLSKFTLTFAGSFALLFAALSFLVSFVVGSFSWRDVAVGFVIGGALALARLPDIISSEYQRLYVALIREWVDAVTTQCREQGVELDIAALHHPVLEAARAKLETATFHAIDIRQELRADA